MNKQTILVTTSTFPRYKNDTLPNFVESLSERLSNNFKVLILTPYIKNTSATDTFRNMEIHRFRYMPFHTESLVTGEGIIPTLKKHRWKIIQIPFFILAQVMAIRKQNKKKQINIIHSHWLLPQGFAAVLYKLLFNRKIKILCTVHGGDIFGLDNTIANWVKSFTLKHIDQVTAVSLACSEKVCELGYKGPIDIIPMGIDTDLFHPDKQNPDLKNHLGINGKMILFAGRLAEKKGVGYLIKAMPLILKEKPDTHLVIIGDGPLREQLEKLSEQMNLTGSISFLGAMKQVDLPEYYASADVFSGPSIITENGDQEGFGLVFAEAMCCGTPVIATDLKAIRDIVKDGETGWVARQKDSEDLAEKIIQALDSDTDNGIHRNGRKHITNNFSWKTISEKYSKLINNMKCPKP